MPSDGRGISDYIRYADSLHQKPLAPSTNLLKNWKVTWHDPKQDIVVLTFSVSWKKNENKMGPGWLYELGSWIT
jgi:hypothetical protein